MVWSPACHAGYQRGSIPRWVEEVNQMSDDKLVWLYRWMIKALDILGYGRSDLVEDLKKEIKNLGY
jgi:hypothetical protein